MKIAASSFDVTGNTLLPAEAIARVLEPFKGQRSLNELTAAAQALQRRYVNEGYGGVVVYVPPQTRGDGVVTIAVVEGKLAAVKVRGGRVFDDDNVLASLPDLKGGVTPRMRRIDTQMQIANENPSKRLRVLLKPGQRAGEVDAEVTVQEEPLQRITLGLDDTGNDRTGNYRASVTWQHANISGHDDVLTGQYQTSPSKPNLVTALSAGYRFPLYRQLMVIDAFVAYSDVDGGSTSTAAGDLRFNGNGHVAGVRSSWYLPRSGDIDQRLSVGLDQREYINRCGIAGLPAGACGTAGASVSVQPLTLEYVMQSSGDPAFGASASLQTNLHLGGRHSDGASFAAIRPAAKPRYNALRFNAFASMAVAETWNMRLRVAGQLTNDALVPGEQFGIGGAASVRGYEEREVAGDKGFFASAELTTPEILELTKPGAPSLRFFGFVDAGQVTNRSGTPCLDQATRCELASWGAGARYEWGKLQARLALAHALRNAVSTQRADRRAHFAISYSF